MVLDTSAILAVLLDEPERPRLERLLEENPARLVSAATLVEASMVLESRHGESGRRALDRMLDLYEVAIVAFDRDQAELARDAFRRFGKGRHPAALNYGDCFAYALAKATGEPLLFKGEDFSRTDIGALQ
jgi:ribonuclease VapC